MRKQQSKDSPLAGDMAELSAIIQYLDALLTPRAFTDSAYNGLQVEGARTVSKVAVAVDCGASIIDKALAAQAELLIVHHGLLWGHEQPLVGAFGEKIKRLIRAGCSVYGSHLPLDAHPEVGNNALLAKHFDLTVDGTFATVAGKPIGVRAHSSTAQPIEYYINKARSLVGFGPHLALPFGAPQIRTVGIVSGSGSSAINEAAALGLDLVISGEPKQAAYHECKDLHLNALFAGHYATETVGVRALGDRLHSQFGVPTVFIDEPTGI